MRSKCAVAIGAVLRYGSFVSDARPHLATDLVTRSSRGSDRQFSSCSWQHPLFAQKIAKLRFCPVQKAQNCPVRPRRQLRNLVGGVPLHNRQKERLAFFRSQRTEGPAELAVLQNVGRIPIRLAVIAFTPLLFWIEREKKNLAVAPIAIDEAVPNRREHIGLLPRSAGNENRQARVLNQILGFDRIMGERKSVAVGALEQRIDRVRNFVRPVFPFGRSRPHLELNNERHPTLIAFAALLSRAPTARPLREVRMPAT